MQRAFAVIAAAGGCILAGCNGAARLKRRHAALCEVRMALERIRLGLMHTNQPVAALLAGCGERETRALFLRLANDVASGSTPLAAWESAEQAGAVAPTGLMQSDQRTLTVFFSLLGGSDRCSQLKHVDATLRMVSMQCTEAKRISQKNGRMYRTLGVLLGAGVAILLL